MANTSGVFSLEELVALGQSGDVRKDWFKFNPGKGPGPSTEEERAPFARKALNPKLQFPAGYYRIPGAQEAVYFDPKTGAVPDAFRDLLDPETGDLKRNLDGVPTAFMADNNVWQAPAWQKEIHAGMDEQRALEAQGLTPQEAQDKRFGARPIVGADDTYKPGIHNTIGASAGAYARFIASGGTDELLGFKRVDESGDFAHLYKKRNETLGDSLAENFMQRYGAQEGLKGLNQVQPGDPREMERLRSTYESLDPSKRSSWLFYQDPGNLTPELREARLEARRGERELIQQSNQYAPEFRYGQQNGKGFQFVVKRGDVSQTEAGTGREKFYGNVPLKAELVKGKYNRIGDIGKRIGGGLAGGFLGFFGSGGNPFGAISGAYQGAGGPAPTKGVAGALWGAGMGAAMGGGWAGAGLGAYSGAGGVNGLKQGGFNSWRGSAGQIPGAMQMGSAIAFARMSGGKGGQGMLPGAPRPT